MAGSRDSGGGAGSSSCQQTQTRMAAAVHGAQRDSWLSAPLTASSTRCEYRMAAQGAG
ncbi:hypothetical protein HaLaN_12159 [Haematococcus lacustris]|uniref:Uncharacterized protein n=1 Tax=Haematococcus lacustris TaxID=44745 RepID=A0A699Z1E4_HAELA|nr:hypothetical protein HaLaN_12159 [Haematococcus lacustris]